MLEVHPVKIIFYFLFIISDVRFWLVKLRLFFVCFDFVEDAGLCGTKHKIKNRH